MLQPRPTHLLLDPALSAQGFATLQRLVRELGAYRTYVEKPVQQGFGVGLVRRHDALLHEIRRKVAEGAVESMEATAARTNLFRGILFEAGRIAAPGVEEILNEPRFLDAARQISGCPVIEPTMLYANLILPGQELMVHTDTPEFFGLAKDRAPEWLLVVMHHSGLFASERIAIAGGVTFLGSCEAGAFRFWPAGAGEERLAPRENIAIKLDADVTFHGVARVGGSDAPPPPARPSMHLVPEGQGWALQDGDRRVHRYAAGEVRVSTQWKARCFASEAERERARQAPALEIDEVVDRIEADLRQRGVLTGPRPADMELAILMIDTYVPFP
ncbi:MAG: hypothetical protein EA397_09920 [Deltaproteobacteria bacterium]|nr:MAG: hypothetical protein EA397_09920 [Deltaproteobacteria bacterium]